MARRKEKRTTRPHFSKKFIQDDISNFPNRKIFHDKWVIIKSFGKLEHAYCYQVCDKRVQIFGRLYVEICDEGMSSVGNMIEFLMKQNSVGNSHRFCNLIDSGLIHDSAIYMVIAERNGPRLSTLLNVCKNNSGKESGFLSSKTTSFFAIDLIQTLEILISTGYVLRSFDPSQWNFDVKHRMIFLADLTDILPITDKRYAVIPEKDFEGFLDLFWRGTPQFAPVNFLIHGHAHQMSETDMIEMSIYILYELCIGKLPWNEVTDLQKVLDEKTQFLKAIPQLEDCKYSDLFIKWFDVCLRNMNSFMKIAEVKHEQFGKLPVRGGAWCPNGSRAGSLITAMNYGSLIRDFQTIITEGKPSYTQHWRNTVLSWEKIVKHTPHSLKILKSCEKLDYEKEIIYEQKLLIAKKRHYEVMSEHGKAERAVNEIEIGEYLKPESEKTVGEKKEEIARVRKCSERKPTTGEKKPVLRKQRGRKMKIDSASDDSSQKSPVKQSKIMMEST